MLLGSMLSPRLPLVLFAAYSAVCAGQTAGHCTVSGTVLNFATNEPIRRALVAVGGSLVFTGGDGRFEIQNVPEGQIMIAAQKPGYFDCSTTDCGGNSSRGTATVTVHSGRNEVLLKLVPEASVQGRIADADNEPVSNVQVIAMGEHIMNGVKVSRPDGGASTDENGNYRIEKLMPGSYKIKTTPRPAFSFYYPASGGLPLQIYPQRFYPNTPDVSSAQALELKPGQAAEADFTLTLVSGVTISGSVAPIVPGLSLAAEDSNGEETTSEMQFDARTGKFMAFVPTGAWTLRFSGRDDQGHSYYAVETVTARSDIKNLRVLLQPLASVPVSIENGSNEDAQPVNVTLAPREPDWRGGVFGGNSPPPAPQTQYLITDVPPGKYNVQAMTGNECIDTVTSGDVDLTRDDLVIRPGSQPQPIHVSLRKDCATLQVSVHSDTENTRSTILLIPSSHAMAPSTVQIEPGGSASFTPLSPGEYVVYAFSSIDDLEYANPEAMREFSGQQITLSPNQHANVTLDAIARKE